MAKPHVPLTPKLMSVALCDQLFSDYIPFQRKVHQMTPNDLDMFAVKYMPSKDTPRGPNFVHLAL